MTCSLAVVVNANAHRGAVMGRPLNQLREALRRDERLYVSHTIEDLDEIARDIVARGMPPLALLGGDGAIMRTLTALSRHAGGALPERLVPLRGGTMNTIADGFGVTRARPDALLRRYRARRAGHERRALTLRADGNVGFLLSTGLMHAFLEAYYDQPLGTGVLGAGVLLARTVASATHRGALARRIAARIDVELVIDGARKAPDSYLFVGAGTVPQVGLGFRPYARATEDADGFHLLAYRGSVAALAAALPRFARGEGTRVADTLDTLARELELTTAGGIAYALDGELLRSEQPLRVTLGPALTVHV